MKVVLDTNVLVSARISPLGKPAQILARVGVFELLLSPEILAEIKDVLQRRHIRRRYHLNVEDIGIYLSRLQEVSTVVLLTITVAVIKDDPDDDKFLALAKQEGADYIISGDPHLTRLETYEGIQILTPAQFLKGLMREELETGE